MPEHKILIVEDEEAIAHVMESILSANHYIPLSAKNGGQALALADVVVGHADKTEPAVAEAPEVGRRVAPGGRVVDENAAARLAAVQIPDRDDRNAEAVEFSRHPVGGVELRDDQPFQAVGADAVAEKIGVHLLRFAGDELRDESLRGQRLHDRRQECAVVAGIQKVGVGGHCDADALRRADRGGRLRSFAVDLGDDAAHRFDRRGAVAAFSVQDS